jgi:hypothetical protein
MNRRVAMIVTLVLIAAALAGVIGTTAYRAGMARGLAEAGHFPGPWVDHGLFWHPGAFLFPLLGLLLSWRWCVGSSGVAGVVATRGEPVFHRRSRSGIAGPTSPCRQTTPPTDRAADRVRPSPSLSARAGPSGRHPLQQAVPLA